MYYTTFIKFETDFLEYENQMKKYKNIKSSLKSLTIEKLYESYMKNPEFFIFNCFPEKKYRNNDWEYYTFCKYEKKDFRFLDDCTENVKSFFIKLVNFQHEPNSVFSHMCFIEEIIKEIKSLPEILEIIEIIEKSNFLNFNDEKIHSDEDLNLIMLKEEIKDNMILNNKKMEILFQKTIKNKEEGDFKLNFYFFNNFIFSKKIHSFIMVEDYFVNAIQKFNEKELNFYFKNLEYREEIILEVLRYFYIGEIIFENLLENEIIELMFFGNEKILNLEKICLRYLNLSQQITSLVPIEIKKTFFSQNNIPYDVYIYHTEYYKIYCINKNEKNYYLSYIQFASDHDNNLKNLFFYGLREGIPKAIYQIVKQNGIMYDFNLIKNIYKKYF